jgi:PAS domain S-box-containing protein
MSLRLRLILLVLLPSIPLFVIVAFTTERVRSSELANARSRLTTLSLLGVAELRAAVEGTEDLLSTLSRVPGVVSGDAQACKRVFEELIGRSGRYGAIYVADRDGNVLCHSSPLAQPMNLADREYFRRARDTGRFVAGDPVIGRITHKPLLGMAYPLRDAAGRFSGILFAGLDLRWFGDRFPEAELTGNVTFAIWAHDGTILYRHPDPDRWTGKRLEDAGITQLVQARHGGTVVSEAQGISGRPTLYAVAGTEAWSASRMAVSAGIPSSVLEAQGNAIFWRNMLVSGLVFGGALAAALLLGELGIRRRAVALADAARAIASGNLSARADLPPRRDELGHLAISFDRMAVALERGTRTLGVLSAGNQALVKARDEDSLLRELCRIIVDDGGYRLCWVGYALDDKARTVKPMAQHGIAAEAMAARRLSWADTEGGRGPVGRAIRSGAPVVVRDIDEDVGDASSRDFARAQGYRAYAAIPIRIRDRVIGVFGIATTEAGRLDEAEVAVLQELADDLGFGIQAVRDRAALDQHATRLEDLVSRRTEEIESANRFLDSIIENIPHIIFVKDAASLHFVRFNRAAEALIGYAKSDLIGKGDWDFFPPAEARAFVQRDREVLAAGHLVEIEEEPIHTRDRGVRYLHTKKLPVLDENGRPRYLLGISEDITERKEREREILELNANLGQRAAQLADANRELEAFSYSVSHDLRAPLRHIQGYVELLASTVSAQLSEKGRRYLQVINDAAGEMGELIDDLLAFSRMARTEMHRTRVDMALLVRECLQGLEMAIGPRNVQWRIDALPAVVGDAAMLKQVWANLLGNAVKYTRPRDPAVIEVGATRAANAPVAFFVRDNGVGFDMEHTRKLFGVFQRLHRAEEFEGTGIGLATVQRIVSRHGGRIWTQAAPDRGATFYFTLGAEMDPDSAHAEERNP